MNCTIGSKPQLSRAYGPPCGYTTIGSFLPSEPSGIVRYPGSILPSGPLILIGFIGASGVFASAGFALPTRRSFFS